MKRVLFQGAAYLVAVLGLLTCSGCGGDGVDLSNVSGDVTFDGKPVVFGQVEFIPDGSKDHKGPPGSAAIIDGHYDTKDGRGIVRGPHHVKITGYDERPVPPPDDIDETKPYLAPLAMFTGYSVDADITGATQDFDVPASAKGFDAGKKASRSVNEP